MIPAPRIRLPVYAFARARVRLVNFVNRLCFENARELRKSALFDANQKVGHSLLPTFRLVVGLTPWRAPRGVLPAAQCIASPPRTP